MARTPNPKIREEDLHGFKHFKLLLPIMERLHHDGCARDRAGNRKLHFDQYTALILLYFFNPIVTSLRGIQQASELGKEQRILGCSRAALGSPGAAGVLDGPLRVVEVHCAPHRKATGHTSRGGPEQGESLLIATDMLDVPAEVIALIYKHRWAIETFFRFFKHVLGCRHLLSHCSNGIEIQVYMGIIACLLIALWTGRKPTLRTYEMICFYFTGLASQEELLAHIEKLAPPA